VKIQINNQLRIRAIHTESHSKGLGYTIHISSPNIGLSPGPGSGAKMAMVLLGCSREMERTAEQTVAVTTTAGRDENWNISVTKARCGRSSSNRPAKPVKSGNL
jgi:hypothetical protein